MNEQEMMDYAAQIVASQGSMGSTRIAPLLFAMIEKIHEEPVTGSSPIVLHIAENGEKQNSRTTYQITTPQEEIDSYVDYAHAMQENTRLFVYDKGVLITFTYLEMSDDSVTGKVVTTDGEFGVFIQKGGGSYFFHDEKIAAIPEVTQGEIDAYNRIFGTTYNRKKRSYNLLLGSVEFPLTPSEMIIVNEEYNKTSTSGDYTALWANSIAKFIHCAPWFKEFRAFNLHSAFMGSKNLIFIDLNRDHLPVIDLTNAFNGCTRLEEIHGIIDLSDGARVTDSFKGCTTLRVFKMHGLGSNIDLSDCPNLEFEVFEELVTYSTMQRITIYVHRDVMENINGNPLWQGVKDAMNAKINVNIEVR